MKSFIYTIFGQLTGQKRYRKLATGKTQGQINRGYVRSAVTAKLRYQILRRDGYQCQICGKCGIEIPLEVDHRVPVALGGKSTPGNLWTLCMNCNRGKGVLE